VLIANTSFVAMTQLDMVLVNALFPPREAGLYAAASILGKAVMYLASGIAMALFPMVAERQARDQSSAHLLIQAVGLAAILCAAGGVGYFVLGEWIVEVFYGPSYAGAGELLRYFGFAMLPMGLVMVAEHFLIAKGRVLFAYLFLATAPLEMLAIYLYHGSLLTVVAIMGASGLLLCVVGYGMLWRTYRKG
jgi:O-antigen/teichoic acid export membrane protein